ncbi:hypothetical protein CEE37_02545 [candidate division LCP-89 bacterium B3_LCP]|uniref:Secretion system C-terminal sorting domain-containing protein n=1 Tax=candidate division LCP-89 bacterium B3_LCP TaxID=2012998 RepID=A0A532V2U2_UNCL8|nr:MAG: hypothetical protein CEE37_02545 [candidate division LCP-89 bacterium B3_LCP]
MNFESDWELVDWSVTLAADIATSEVSDKTAVGWSYSRWNCFPECLSFFSSYNNDIYLKIEEDGQEPDFRGSLNLTNFISPDTLLCPDTLMACMDTLRAVADLSLYIDQNDYVHAAFSTCCYFELWDTTHANSSIIWHWSEQYPEDFSIIHEAIAPADTTECGAWNFAAQRPSLGQDPGSGYLYCMYQVFDLDPTHQSEAGHPSGEIYISVSTDGGLNWSEGKNVTNTITPQNAPPGECLSEYTPSMRKTVDGECDIMYILDYDAGSVIYTSGAWTLNDVIYHKVSVDSISTTPLVPQNIPFHVAHGILNPAVVVTLDPVYPTSIPPPGGELEFNIEVANHDFYVQTFDVWCDITLPNGQYYGPVIGPVNLTMQSSTAIDRDRIQSVPAGAPVGDYMYNAYLGMYPDSIWCIDNFEFTKQSDGGGDFVEGWLNWGEEFDQWMSNPIFRTEIPQDFAFSGIYPNPFNPTTQFSFALPAASHVKLSVYNLRGQLVSTLVDGMRDAGTHEVAFDASDLASGIYLYRLNAGNNNISGKIVLVK